MDIKIFNKKIMITILATFTFLIGGFFGAPKIFAEEEELTDEEVFYATFDVEKMVEHPGHRYVPVIAKEGLFDIEIKEAGSKLEVNLTILDGEILDLIKRGNNLEFDLAFMGVSTEKIKLYEFNQFELEMEWLGTGENSPLEENEFMDVIELIERLADRNMEENTHFNELLDSFSVRIYDSDLVLEDIIVYQPSPNKFLVYADQNGGFVTIDLNGIYEFYKFENFYKHAHMFENKIRVDNGFLNIIEQENSFEIDEPSTAKYTIQFLDIEGNVIDIQEVEEGAMPSIPEPTHPVGGDKYIFVSWGQNVTEAYEDRTYIAYYEVVKFIVKFLDGDRNIIDHQNIEYGQSAIPPTNNLDTFDKIFIGWDKSLDNITDHTDFYARYEPREKISVTFKNIDGSIIEVLELYKGQPIKAPLAKFISDNELFEYIFKKWDKDLDEVAERDVEYIAEYDILKRFKITFKNSDGSIITEEIYLEGDSINEPKNIEHPENSDKFKFIGWDKEIVVANEDTVYTSVYEVNKFTVKFLDLKGKVIGTQVVEYGESAVYPVFEQETIDKILTGWEGEIDNITSNQTFKATFELKELFFITFKNIDGSIIEVLEIYKGQTIKAPLANFISDNELFEYVFTGWDKELDEVAERNIEYTAEYEITKKFRVIFKNSDGSIILEEIYLEGDLVNSPKNIEHPTNPEKYKFLGFTPNLKPVIEDTEYIAVYEVRSFRVRFYFDNKVLNTQTVLYGENANSPKFEIENFTFKGWDSEFRNITKDTDIFAIYEENQSYELTIKVNGKIVETIKLYESIYQFDITKYLNQNKNYKLVEVLDKNNNDYIVEEGKLVVLNGLFEDYEINIIMEIKDTYEVTFIHPDGTEEVVVVYEGDLAPQVRPSIKDMIFVGWINSETLEYDDLRKPVNSDLKYFLDYKERDLTLDVPIFEKEDAIPGTPWNQIFTIKKPGAGIDNYKNHQVLFAMDGIEDFDEIVYITVTIKHTYKDGGGGFYFPGFEGTRSGFYVYEADKEFSIRYLKNPGEFKNILGTFGWVPWITGSEVREYTMPAENVSGWGDGYIMNNLFSVETEFVISFATKNELDEKPEHPDFPGEEIPGNDDQSFLDKVIEFVKKYIGYIIFILITVFILNLVSSKIRKNNRNRKRNKKKNKKKRR